MMEGVSDVIEIESLVRRSARLGRWTGWTCGGAVRRGSHGFLGPNGARGKSTTIRVLLGLLRADAGAVRLLGGDPWADAPALHRQLAMCRAMSHMAESDGRRDRRPARRRTWGPGRRGAPNCWSASTSTRPRRAQLFRAIWQKVALVAALASDIELLLLDEPTSGLDPLMEQVFTQLIRDEHARGRTVLLESHPRRGRSPVRPGEHHPGRARRQAGHWPNAPPDTNRWLPTLTLRQWISRSCRESADVVLNGHRLTAHRVDASALGAVLGRLAGHGIRSLTSSPPTLEDLFLRHYDEGCGMTKRRRGSDREQRVVGPVERHRLGDPKRILRADRWFWVTWIADPVVLHPATASAYRSTISDDAAGTRVTTAGGEPDDAGDARSALRLAHRRRVHHVPRRRLHRDDGGDRLGVLRSSGPPAPRRVPGGPVLRRVDWAARHACRGTRRGWVGIPAARDPRGDLDGRVRDARRRALVMGGGLA